MTGPGQGAGRDDIFREVLKLQGLIRAVLRRYGVPAADAPDLAQEVLITAYRRIGEGAFSPPDPTRPLAENVAAWVRGIARWIAIESHRAKAQHDKVFGVPTRANPVDQEVLRVPTPADVLDAKDELRVIAQLKLKPMQRKTVALAALGYSAREIGERLGIPEDTAATHLKRARKAYEKAMKREKASGRG